MKNERGVTLIELLAAITLSSIILILGMSIFGSLTGAGERSLNTTNLRNESVLISQHLDRVLENADDIVITAPATQESFTSFRVIDIRKIGPSPDDYTIEIINGNLLIDGIQINSDGYTLDQTTFKKNGAILTGNIIVKDDKNGKSIEINKVYRLSEGGENGEDAD